MPETEPAESDDVVSNGTNESCAVDRRDTARGRSSAGWSKRVWSTGSYRDIAPNYLSMGAHLVERTDVGADDRVLDVACGTGTVAITAARRGARVSGIDVAPSLLDTAREAATVADLDDVRFLEGDATAIPFERNAFDATLSNLGHVYGDPPDDAAEELCRVTRPGGRIGFTSWTPTGLYPSMAGVVTAVLSPADLPPFSEPPFLWGDPGTVERRIGSAVSDLTFETDVVRYPAPSPAHFLREMETTSGPFIDALEAVPDDRLPPLREQLVGTIEPYFDDRENAVALEYLLATATVTASG